MAELSPMMQQYLEIKKQHKDEILFYRIGDFYEMFFDDALTASKELDLTLTGKQCGMEERAPMCGVPFHSYEGYVARLIAKGYKVAICEQVEDPAKAKGLVKRDIIRVVTPGTVIESSMLQDDRNNYIASIFLKGKKAGLCFADVSTGTAHITELNADKIAPAVITELCRYHPSEVLMNPGLLDCREVTAYCHEWRRPHDGTGAFCFLHRQLLHLRRLPLKPAKTKRGCAKQTAFCLQKRLQAANLCTEP